jgi:ADP-ribose pyrophosphatase YjhB (NUDIX family)
MSKQFETFRHSLEPLMRRLFHFYWRFARGLTLGVRAVVIDGTGRVFLVKHSYVAGWHLPGGGVEVGETLMTALMRELREEGNIELGEQPDFFAVYFNRRASRRDHVALYVVRAFRQSAPPQPNHEIIAHGFFAPDALPEETTRATRARIAEVLDGRTVAELW